MSGDLKGKLSDEGAVVKTLNLTVVSNQIIRGLAGTVLVYKIAGAIARRGSSLDDVYNVAVWLSTRLGTVGVGLEHCHVCDFFHLDVHPAYIV